MDAVCIINVCNEDKRDSSNLSCTISTPDSDAVAQEALNSPFVEILAPGWILKPTQKVVNYRISSLQNLSPVT